MDLSIIIVNYKTKDLTLQAITSVFAAKPPKNKMEVILIDNNSDDLILKIAKKKFPQLITIQNQTNLGFAAANNLGLRKAKADYILLLNSDTVVNPDTLVKMVDLMKKNPRVGLSTCKVELPDGQLDKACHRGFPTPWASLTYYLGLEKIFPKSKLFSQYHLGWKNLNTAHEIDSPSGAFFLLNKKALNQSGLLDEKFFMYGEDLDLSFRIKQNNWQIYFFPETKITHFKGASGIKSSKTKDQRLKSTKDFFEAQKIFFQKHYQKKFFPPYNWFIYSAITIIKILKIIIIKLS